MYPKQYRAKWAAVEQAQEGGNGAPERPAGGSAEYRAKWAAVEAQEGNDERDDDSVVVGDISSSASLSVSSSVPLPLPKVPGLLPVRTSFGGVRDRDEFGTYLEKETPKIRAAIEKAAGKHIPVIGVEVGVEHGDFANEVGRYAVRAEGQGCLDSSLCSCRSFVTMIKKDRS